ncbi:MAG: hypothetical protein ACJAVR_002821 [Paracoccaceae bacterium]|jgi:hypothetical protein
MAGLADAEGPPFRHASKHALPRNGQASAMPTPSRAGALTAIRCGAGDIRIAEMVPALIHGKCRYFPFGKLMDDLLPLGIFFQKIHLHADLGEHLFQVPALVLQCIHRNLLMRIAGKIPLMNPVSQGGTIVAGLPKNSDGSLLRARFCAMI